MGAIDVQCQGNAARAAFAGRFTVETAESVRKELLAALIAAERIELDMAGVEGADVTFLQVLESLLKSAESLGKQVVLHGEPPVCLREIARKMGVAPGTSRLGGFLA